MTINCKIQNRVYKMTSLDILKQQKKELLNKKNILKDAYIQMVGEKNVSLYNMDLLGIATINLACSNIAAFISLSKDENHLAAIAITRIQLDCLLKLFLPFIVKNPQEIARKVVFGQEPLKKLNLLINGKKTPITDTFLCQHLEKIEKLDWVVRVYRRTSQFIHPSDFHLMSVIDAQEKNPDGSLTVKTKLSLDGKTSIKMENLIESYKCMNHITSLICKYLAGWAYQKHLTKQEYETIKDKRIINEAFDVV